MSLEEESIETKLKKRQWMLDHLDDFVLREMVYHRDRIENCPDTERFVMMNTNQEEVWVKLNEIS